MQNRRHERVRELLKRRLSEILLREFPVLENGLMTVNDVVVSGDLRLATVFVGIVGGAEQKKKGLDGLIQQRKRLQGMVGSSVILKYTPELRFVVDESVARGNRVLQIIDEIEKTFPAETS